MPLALIRAVGKDGLYFIQEVDAVDPGFGQGGSERPDNSLPGGGGRPPRPDQGLPGSGAHPGNRPPGSGGGGIPDNELPDTPPPQVAPGATLVMIRGPQGKWVYAAIDPGQPPPKPLPPAGGGEHPANRPPGSSPGHPSGQPVPPPPSGNRPDQGLPPTAAPKR